MQHGLEHTMIYDENKHNRVNIRNTYKYKITFVAETNDIQGYSRQIIKRIPREYSRSVEEGASAWGPLRPVTPFT